MIFDLSFDEITGHAEILDGSTIVPADAFSDISEVKSVTIPDSVNTIRDNAFRIQSLTKAVVGDSVKSIGGYAFYDNPLKEVVIGDSVETIGDYAFYYNSLTEVVIPDSVISIGTYAFYDNGLEKVVIGDSVNTIGDYAFYENQLTEVVIPDSVTSIGNYAFYDNLLKEVTLPAHFNKNPPLNAFDKEVLFVYSEPKTKADPRVNTIKSVGGKRKLRGTSFADAFAFDSFQAFTKKAVKKIIGFDSSKRDTILVTPNAFPALKGVFKINFVSTDSKKELKLLSKQFYNFVYFEKKGRLYFDGNGADTGWGNSGEGGLFAVLIGQPELNVRDFTLLD